MLITRIKFKTIVKEASTSFVGFSIDCPNPHPHQPIFPLLLNLFVSNKQVNSMRVIIAFCLYT